MPINKNNKGHNILLSFLLLMVGLSFNSCYENQEGCLDPDSSNYDVTADVECEDCCTYPSLSLLIAYVFEDTSYNRVDPISNDMGVEFVVEEVKLYLSGISLSDGINDYKIEEVMEFVDGNGEDQEITDDFILVTPSSFRHTIGTFTESHEYTSLSIGLGVADEVDQALSITVTSDHPLAIAGDSLYIVDQNQYVNAWIGLRQIGFHEGIIDTLQVAGMDYTFDYDDILISQSRGSSLDVNMKVDYAKIIAGIDYNTMSSTEIKNQIGSNMKTALLPNF